MSLDRAEEDHFAQLKPLYDEVGIPRPIIYPRASATIVEEKAEKVALAVFGFSP